MSQGAFDLRGGVTFGIAWTRHPTVCRADYQMTDAEQPTGYWVKDCGHPTALRPYYVVTPAGEILERKFRTAAEAKAAAVLDLGSRSRP